MFDTYYHTTRHAHNHTVHVTEKRAPTDESVRLLKEFEAAAQKKIDQSIRLDDNTLKAVVHKMYDPMMLHDRYAVLMKLNGRDIRIDVDVDTLKSQEPHDQWNDIFEAIARRLTAEIMPQVVALNRFK